MARTTYDGYGLTELRTIARELQIPGRSRMDGKQLLVACRDQWDANRQAKENAVLRTLTPVPRALLTMVCGCVIKASTHMLEHPAYGSLYVLGEYVSACDHCQVGRRAATDVEYINREATGAAGNAPYKFMIYQMRPAGLVGDTGPDGTPM